MAKLPISVCMISGSEAGRIGRALQSVADWTGEVIVLLNEDVRDGTDALCEARGAKVFREPWKGYVAQKNSAAEKASYPWILSLDADEEVPLALWAEIAAMLDDPGKSRPYAAFDFPRCSYYCGRWIRHGDWYPDRCIRLWKKGLARWLGNEIHEKLQVDGCIGRLHHDLLHYTAETINYQIAKTVRYADAFAQHRLDQAKAVHFLDLLARPLWRFIRGYVFRLGFMDGWQGFAIAWLTAFYTFLRYVRAREAQMKQDALE